MVVSEDSGDGVITSKRGVDAIFEDRHYSDIFPPRPKIPHRFPRMYVAYRLFRLVNDLGYATAKDYRRQRHGFWNSLWLLHRGMTLNGAASLGSNTADLARAFDSIYKRRRTRRIIRGLTKAIWHAWRVGRKKDPELYTPNNFFKSKYGNQRILALAYPKISKDLRSLSKDLSRAL